jgi:hypothetical protein
LTGSGAEHRKQVFCRAGPLRTWDLSERFGGGQCTLRVPRCGSVVHKGRVRRVELMFGQFFGEFLLQRRAVTRLQLDAALRYQKERNKPVGLMAMDFGLLNGAQVSAVMEEQLVTGEQFGRIAVMSGLLTEESLHLLLAQQAEDHLLIGEALVEMEHLHLNDLEELLKEFRRQNVEEVRRIRRLLEAQPQAELLALMAMEVQRCLGRVLSGKVKIEDILPDWRGPALVKSIVVRLSCGGGTPIECTVHLSRTVVLPFVYCLLQKETWSERFIDEALSRFGRSVGYAVSAAMARAGTPAVTEGPQVRGLNTPDPAAVVFRLISGIGPFFLSLSIPDGAGPAC